MNGMAFTKYLFYTYCLYWNNAFMNRNYKILRIWIKYVVSVSVSVSGNLFLIGSGGLLVGYFAGSGCSLVGQFYEYLVVLVAHWLNIRQALVAL
jgi:hypothetical protein